MILTVEAQQPLATSDVSVMWSNVNVNVTLRGALSIALHIGTQRVNLLIFRPEFIFFMKSIN